jgi:16S rRNA (cytosine967-C5)-methyltransferase
MTRPGGTLIYCACSLQPEEGPAQVEALLKEGGFARVPVQADEVGGLAEAVTAEGDVRTLPCHLAAEGGMDGFYIARLRKL